MSRIAISIHHPAHVHFFKNSIREFKSSGHAVSVFVRNKEIVTNLLDKYDIDYKSLGEKHSTKIELVRNALRYELFLYRELRSFNPDYVLSVGSGVLTAYIATLVNATSIAFNDSEAARIQNLLGHIIVDEVYTPSTFTHDLGDKHTKYEGYHELAYLHPNRFSPDPDRLLEHGVDPEEEYYVIRFIAWDALHDAGESGLSASAKRELISTLEDTGTVYITSEDALPEDFEDYRLPVPPEYIHDLLYYADIYVGDSQTMATEAAVLGTPSIRSNTFAGDGDMGNFVELEENYGLLYSTPDEKEALLKMRELISDPNLALKWEKRRKQLLKDKLDVTQVVFDSVEEKEK